MSDPISILGVVIAISTFVKDIIKLAQEIQKSVDKVPQNRKNLRKLAADIAKNVMEIGKVYDERKDVVDGSDELHTALADLSKHMHTVYAHCCALTIPNASGRVSKLRAAFKAWSNCNAVEAEIQELKDEVKNVSIRFMMFALARIEKPIFTMFAATSRMEQKLDVLDQHQQQGLSRMEGFVAKFDDGYSQIRATITTTTTSSQDALQIAPEAIGALYLHQQVEVITSSLGNLATRFFPGEEPCGPYLEPFKPVTSQWGTNQSPAARHREVVAAALEIIDILHGPPGELSVQYGAWDMVNLAIRLYKLEMYSDAATIGSWTVDLYRTLLGTNAEVYEPYLNLALRNLSRYKREIGDSEGAVKDLEECIMRERDMLKKPSKHSVHLELSNSLIEWWSVVIRDGNLDKGLEIAEESLALLEGIRAELEEWKGRMLDGTSSLETVVIEPDIDVPFPHPLNSIQGWNDASTLWLDYNMAETYHSLSCSLEDAGRVPEACDRELQALIIFRNLYDRHPGMFSDEGLAKCLAHLARTPLSNNLSTPISVGYMQESIEIFRKLSASRPTVFTPCLIETLWDYANLLHDTGNFDAAQQCSTEALDLTRQSTSDPLLLANALQQSSWSLRRLKQNETAVTIRREVIQIYRDLSTCPTAELDPKTVADRLYDLASDYIVVDQIDEATTACREAVERYRSIPPSGDDSTAHLADLAKGLSYLTYTLNFAAKQLSQALMIGSEALRLYRRLIPDDPSLIQPYLNTLQRVGFSACHANDRESIKIHAEVVEDFRKLVIDYPDHVKWRLVDAFHDHDYILTKHKLTHEALLNTQELVAHLRQMPLDGSEVPSKLIAALTTHAGNYGELGRVGESLLLCKKAITIGEKYTADTDESEIALNLVDALSAYSECLRWSGKYDEALLTSKAALDIYRRHPRDDATILACRLREYAINLQHANRLPEAITVAEEAVGLCRSSSSTTLFVKFRLPYVLETLSTGVVEAGDEERAFVIIQEATVLYRKIKSNPTIAEPWSYAETLYANALVNLSSQFAARSKWEEAEAAISEATAIYKSRVVFASGYYPPLARALDLMSIQLCAAGRHEEAVLAAEDLLNQKHHLSLMNPEVAMLVGVALAELEGRSFLSTLRQKHLHCTQCSSAQI